MTKHALTLNRLQAEHRAWADRNFGSGPHESWKPLLGISEEVGELDHAFLKRAQGIPLKSGQKHEAAIFDAVGDILIFLTAFCNAEGIDMQNALATTWSAVKQRNYRADLND